jgi:hypothetical protein
MKDLLLWEEEEAILNEPEDPDADLMGGENPTRLELRLAALDDRAREEMDWFFGTLGGRVPEENSELAYARPAAEAIDGWLKAVPAFHRGALALRFTPKEWPPTLTDRYGTSTSLVVRLECALHPSRGDQTTEALEQVATLRLEEAIAKRGWDKHNLLDRAMSHEFLAIRAYLKVRGEGLYRVRIPKRASAGGDTPAVCAPIASDPPREQAPESARVNDPPTEPAPVSAEGGHR